MTQEQFLTYQKFNEEIPALAIGEIMKANNIEYLIENTSIGFDATFANNEFTKEYRIKIKKDDFEKADRLLEGITLTKLDEVEKDYYLFEFTDEELMEIITKRDEWNQFDFVLAQKILKDRGKEINSEVVTLLKKQRIKELAKPEEGQRTWIVAGYILAFLGGLLGIFTGWHLLTHKKILPNGDKVYGYTESDRKHGFYIFIIGVVFFVLWVTIRIGNYF